MRSHELVGAPEAPAPPRGARRGLATRVKARLEVTEDRQPPCRLRRAERIESDRTETPWRCETWSSGPQPGSEELDLGPPTRLSSSEELRSEPARVRDSTSWRRSSTSDRLTGSEELARWLPTLADAPKSDSSCRRETASRLLRALWMGAGASPHPEGRDALPAFTIRPSRDPSALPRSDGMARRPPRPLESVSQSPRTPLQPPSPPLRPEGRSGEGGDCVEALRTARLTGGDARSPRRAPGRASGMRRGPRSSSTPGLGDVRRLRRDSGRCRSVGSELHRVRALSGRPHPRAPKSPTGDAGRRGRAPNATARPLGTSPPDPEGTSREPSRPSGRVGEALPNVRAPSELRRAPREGAERSWHPPMSRRRALPLSRPRKAEGVTMCPTQARGALSSPPAPRIVTPKSRVARSR